MARPDAARLIERLDAARAAGAPALDICAGIHSLLLERAGLPGAPVPPELRAALARDAAALEPDIIPAFFERSLARKPIGAYYTQADVAGYIVRATLIPAVIDRAAAARPDTFGAGGRYWRALPEHAATLVHADTAHGAELPLPPEVAAGITDVARRSAWDTLAPNGHALPNETWREVVARRARHTRTAALLANGAVATPADLITLNLDLARAGELLAEACDTPEELHGLWQALGGLRVLDPTCGAGAFLLAAARALAPLYHACLRRIDAIGDGALREAAALADRPHGRDAGVLAMILSRNLHGVDLLHEAIGVCRMRLGLEGAAHRAPPPEVAGLRAGDALLGLDWAAAFPEALAGGGFDVVVGNPPYVALGRGERAPYERAGYRTATGGNLYALVIERALGLLRPGGRLGMIVPVASVATDGMAALQALYAPLEQWHSHYAVRPARLFDGVDMNLTITLLHNAPGARHSAGYRRWSSGARGERRTLFTNLAYSELPQPDGQGCSAPKLGSATERGVLEAMLRHRLRLGDYVTSSGTTIYYHSGGRYWRKALPRKLSSHYKPLTLPPGLAPIGLCLLNSQLFYWYWIVSSNCMDVVAREALGLPVFALERADPAPYAALAEELLAAYEAGRRTRSRRGARIRVDEDNFDVTAARPVIDRIDALLATSYGLSDQELDFVRSYDRKYRAGVLRAATRIG